MCRNIVGVMAKWRFIKSTPVCWNSEFSLDSFVTLRGNEEPGMMAKKLLLTALTSFYNTCIYAYIYELGHCLHFAMKHPTINMYLCSLGIFTQQHWHVSSQIILQYFRVEQTTESCRNFFLKWCRFPTKFHIFFIAVLALRTIYIVANEPSVGKKKCALFNPVT
jgi:hypothetical protein